MLRIFILLIFLILSIISAERNHEWRCTIPVSMKGTYKDYHRHFKTDNERQTNGHVNIHNDRISNRGECVINRGDYYLFYNKRKNCYSCMLLQLKHVNIIRYKETLCDGAINFNSFEDLCSQIGSGYLWDMLIRHPLLHHHCIFRDHKMRFTYTDIKHAHCSNGVFSLAEMHADRTKVKLHFKHCVPNAMYNNEELSFRCIGEWQYGEDNNMIVDIFNEEDDDDDAYDNLRCIKYIRKHSHDIYRTTKTLMSVASSWDCGLLHNATTGALVLNFIEDTVYSPKLSCSFPDWLYQNTWNDFIGSLFLKSSQSNDFKVYSYHPLTNHKSLRRVFRCYLMIDYFLLDDEFTFVSLTTSDWSTSLQCLMLQKKSNHVAILKEGRQIARGEERRCFEEDYSPMHIASSGDNENDHVKVVDYDDDSDFDVENNKNNNEINEQNNNDEDMSTGNNYNKKINSDNRHYYTHTGDYNNHNTYDYKTYDNHNYEYNHHHHHKLHYFPPIECPFHSFHHSLLHHDCVHRIDLACVWPFIVHFEPLCVSKLPRSKFQCIDWWKKNPENDVVVILMQELLSKTLFCMQLDIKSHALRISCDEEEKYHNYNNNYNINSNNNKNNNNKSNNNSQNNNLTDMKLHYNHLNDSHLFNILLPQYTLLRNEPCTHPATDLYRGHILPWSLDYFQKLEPQQINRLRVLYHSLECHGGDCGVRSGVSHKHKNNNEITHENGNSNKHYDSESFVKRLKQMARSQEQDFVDNYYSSPFYQRQKQLQGTNWRQNYRHQRQKILNRYQRNKIDTSWSNNSSKTDVFALPTTKKLFDNGNFSFDKLKHLSNLLNLAVVLKGGAQQSDVVNKEGQQTSGVKEQRGEITRNNHKNNITIDIFENTTVQRKKIDFNYKQLQEILKDRSKMKMFWKQLRSYDLFGNVSNNQSNHPDLHDHNSTSYTTVQTTTQTTISSTKIQSKPQRNSQILTTATEQTTLQTPAETSTHTTLPTTPTTIAHPKTTAQSREAVRNLKVVKSQNSTTPQHMSYAYNSRQTYKKDHFIYNAFDQGVEGFYSGVKRFEALTKLFQDSLFSCTFKQFHFIEVYFFATFIFVF